jgi:hypothetical protein
MEERPMTTMRTIAMVLLMASSLACGSTDNGGACAIGQIMVAGKCQAISSDAGGGNIVAALPFAVDSHFGADGYMGDGAAGGITPSDCPQRAGEMKGTCHRFTWMPGAIGWGGVFWQNPRNFWGTDPTMGLQVAPGAKQVTFWAWGAQGGESVSFAAGYGPTTSDGFKRTKDVVLTTSPTMQTIDLSGITYTRVGGGFAWTANHDAMPGSTAAVTFMVDDIQWR